MADRVTSADVARAAGVSRATVSYVLNDTPHQTISPATRARVLAAAEGLGYAPSAAARTLRTGRSDVVLCLLPDWPIGDALGAMLTGLSGALARAGLTFVAHPGSREDRPVAEIWKAITPAAVLSFTAFTPAETAALRSAGVALVAALLGGAPGPGVPQEQIGRLQARHLRARGHTRLGYAYPADDRVRAFADLRLAGAGGPADLAVRVVAPEPAAEAVRGWRDAGVTGVCAYNDEVALAVLAGARAAGVRVPDELAVIGADDLVAARLATPALTTVALDHAAIAAGLAETVVAAVRGGPAPAATEPDVLRVVPRESA